MISKVIVRHISHILSAHISQEKFGLFNNRLIHYFIAMAWECIHTIHTKKKETIVMKVDLQVYDYMDWSYICLILVKVGLHILYT